MVAADRGLEIAEENMTEKNGKNVIHTEHLKKYYVMGDIEVRALNDISLDIDYGEFTAIMGPSGSGKSTLMNILGCLDRPTDGIYLLDGIDVSQMDDSELAEIRNRKVGFVFQSFNLLPRSTALENVMLPILYSKNKANAKERAAEALELVGLGSRMKHKPKELSGGQQQRVAVARALVNDPEIIMADEPTGNLDSKSGGEIMELLIKLNQERGKTIIMVTHDPRIGRHVPRVISVFDGMLGTEEEQAVIRSWVKPDGEDIPDIKGKSSEKKNDGNDKPTNGKNGTNGNGEQHQSGNQDKNDPVEKKNTNEGEADDPSSDDDPPKNTGHITATEALIRAFGNGKSSPNDSDHSDGDGDHGDHKGPETNGAADALANAFGKRIDEDAIRSSQSSSVKKQPKAGRGGAR